MVSRALLFLLAIVLLLAAAGVEGMAEVSKNKAFTTKSEAASEDDKVQADMLPNKDDKARIKGTLKKFQTKTQFHVLPSRKVGDAKVRVPFKASKKDDVEVCPEGCVPAGEFCFCS